MANKAISVLSALAPAFIGVIVGRAIANQQWDVLVLALLSFAGLLARTRVIRGIAEEALALCKDVVVPK